MSREEVLVRLRDILTQDLNVPAAAIHENAHFRADLRLDSLSLVDLIFLIQKDFGFKAGMEEFRNTRTVGAVADFVVTKLASGSR